MKVSEILEEANFFALVNMDGEIVADGLNKVQVLHVANDPRWTQKHGKLKVVMDPRMGHLGQQQALSSDTLSSGEDNIFLKHQAG